MDRLYQWLKSLLFALVPKSLVWRFETRLRKLLYLLFYKGQNTRCIICTANLSGFIDAGRGRGICPACGSLPRNRRLFNLLMAEDLKDKTVLHFSPPKSLKKRMSEMNLQRYVSSDYMSEFQADEAYDITYIDVADSTFDLVICYHVLEHVENDHKAMQEIFRILKKDGRAYIQTPFKQGDIYEDLSIQSAEDRRKHFGQEDHFRIYSVDGLKRRLQKTGFDVSVMNFKKNDEQGLALETVLLATKW